MARKAHPWFRKSEDCWYVKLDGKPVRLVNGRKNGAAAISRWHELMAERAANPVIDAEEHTIASIIELYLAHIESRRAPRTYENCRYYLQLFAEAHGYRLISESKPIHLTNWLDRNPQWESDWTLSNVVGTVQRPFNWAARQELINRNPFRTVRHRTGAPRRPMTDEEFRVLLRATARSRRGRTRKRPSPGERFRQVLFFLRYTGMRPGEMAALTWNDIDLDGGVIILHEHKTSKTQRVPKPRVVPLVVKLLIRIRSRQDPETKHVFLTSCGTPWSRHSLGLRMRRLREKAGLPKDLKLYGIRHNFGTKSVMNGVDLKTLAELMGHSTTRMTEHYVHLVGRDKHLAAAMKKAVSSHQDG